MDTQDRFLKKVNKTDDCWIWLGAKKTRSGYGNFFYRKKVIHAHRASYLIFIGSIPDNLYVCHHCDNPSCVNPKHLFIGTQDDNMKDMIKKNRSGNTKGSKNGNSKLSEGDILEIRQSEEYSFVLAKKYSISPTQVCNIRKRKVWKHI